MEDTRQDKPNKKMGSGSTPLHVTQVGSRVLITEHQKMLADQLVVQGGPKGLDRDHADLLWEAVVSGIASYNPGTDDLCLIASAADILPYLVNA